MPQPQRSLSQEPRSTPYRFNSTEGRLRRRSCCLRGPRGHIVQTNDGCNALRPASQLSASHVRRFLQGRIPALVTPFRDGALDEETFVKLVERQIAAGAHGLVPVGTTGETATLSHDEHRRVVELCVRTAGGRVPVIAGAGSNSTEEAIELVRHAKAIGAHAALVVAPYYNRPSQEGSLPAFRRDQRGGADARGALQRALAHGRGHLQRDRRASGAICPTSPGSRTPRAIWPGPASCA